VAEVAVSASPVARRTAQRLGVVLATVPGSGPRGRIFKADVVLAAKRPAVAAPAAPAPMARATAAASLPDFQASVDVDMSALLAFRDELGALADPPPSVEALVVKAMAAAVRDDGEVGLALASDDGLVVAALRGANRLSLGEIARVAGDLAARARAGDLAPEELATGTFAVADLGGLGLDRFAARADPPQEALLCVGAITSRAVVAGDDVVVRPVAELTLVCDQHDLDAARAAEILTGLRTTLEQPLRMLI
jgi:pyruvate dehydrogenase E2 component (dihydrolipoamide acetyltransferase)